MSTDKIQALHNPVVERYYGEPPSPPTFFDEEPTMQRRLANRLRRLLTIFGGTPKFQKSTSENYQLANMEFHQRRYTKRTSSAMPKTKAPTKALA